MTISVFGLLSISMVVGALLLLTPALLRKSSRPNVAHDELNIVLHRQRLRELNAERDSGVLSAETYEQARIELAQALLDDVPADATPSQALVTWQPAWRTLTLIGVTIPVLAITLYLRIGEPGLATLALDARNAINQPTAAKDHAGAEMVAGLALRLQSSPDDGAGWAMLGRSYVVIEQPAQAAMAFAKAHALIGDEPALLADYAEALALTNNDNVEGKPLVLVSRALALDPDSQKALWLAGVAAMQRSDGPQAAQHWRRLAQQIPAGSQERSILEQYIDEAAGTGIVTTPDQSTVKTKNMLAAGAGSIEVSIALDPALLDRVAPDAILYVYARATNGPRIPLAIVRKSAKALPLTVTLDDSQAMTPELVLSGFPQVDVGARISQRGNAMAESGDLQGESVALKTARESRVAIIIDHVLP